MASQENSKLIDDKNLAAAGLDWSDVEVPAAIKPPADAARLEHRNLREGIWWQHIPAFAEIDEDTFLDHKWQSRNSVTRVKTLLSTIRDLVSPEFYDDVAAGFARATMSVRITPYVLSLIDWENPYDDPLRRQFLPVASMFEDDHPKLDLDSLHEQADSPTPGLTHRYVDKALFLALNTCPVYCRFCTRSYAVGLDTEEVEKVRLTTNKDRWKAALAYVASRPELEDIVISGGDAYSLRPDWIREIGHALLNMPNIRRMRFATKGPAIFPQKVITDHAWVDAIAEVADRGRRMGKDVCLHTHFNTAQEITSHSMMAMQRFMDRGIHVRNQAVLQRGVNDTLDKMDLLVRRLAWIHAHPYYVYMHDLVRGVEDLRTPLHVGIALEKHVRGTTAGFNTPTFVCDAPGGGGKRAIHSYEHYNRDNGIAVYSAPKVKKDALFMYFDPLHSLSAEAKERWADKKEQARMIAEAYEAAKDNQLSERSDI